MLLPFHSPFIRARAMSARASSDDDDDDDDDDDGACASAAAAADDPLPSILSACIMPASSSSFLADWSCAYLVIYFVNNLKPVSLLGVENHTTTQLLHPPRRLGSWPAICLRAPAPEQITIIQLKKRSQFNATPCSPALHTIPPLSASTPLQSSAAFPPQLPPPPPQPKALVRAQCSAPNSPRHLQLLHFGTVDRFQSAAQCSVRAPQTHEIHLHWVWMRHDDLNRRGLGI